METDPYDAALTGIFLNDGDITHTKKCNVLIISMFPIAKGKI